MFYLESLGNRKALFDSSGVQYASAPFLTEVWTYHNPGDFIYKVYFTNKKVSSVITKVPD
ncbi:DUF2845 domain-containing protein [Legionella longbeachae]|uniref:DUF2845 domain-containing protein n=1 Tax=Legionella longbeachae TaxID=450 RepID=UPI00124896C9|nr:hypothetical protein FQU71_12240 [Legionella longbeachae]